MDLNETRERIIYEKTGPIARITLNWPEKANAQDQKLAEEVDAALLDADRDYDIKVVILKANGKGFCSGHAIGDNAVDYPSFRRGRRAHGHAVEGADGPVRQADAEPVGVLQADDRPGARLLPRWRHPLRADHRHRDRLRRRLLLLPAAAGVRHAVGRMLHRAMGFHELAPRGLLPVHRRGRRRQEGARSTASSTRWCRATNSNDRVESIARHIAQAPLTTLMLTKANIKRAWELMGMRVHWQSSNDLVALASMSKDVQALIGRCSRTRSSRRRWRNGRPRRPHRPTAPRT